MNNKRITYEYFTNNLWAWYERGRDGVRYEEVNDHYFQKILFLRVANF